MSEPDEVLEWRRVHSRPGPELPLFEARVDVYEHPDSGERFDRVVLSSADWVNVLPFTADGRLVMVRQFRFGVGHVTLETPAGLVDPGEDLLAAARRELREETGYAGGRWRYLGRVYANPAFHDNYCHHYLAEGVTREAEASPGAGERIAVDVLDLAEVKRRVRAGEVLHPLTLSPLARVVPDLWRA